MSISLTVDPATYEASVAAHARALGLTLVTSNAAEFERVSGLALENRAVSPRRRG
jgi:predicted nucleic acid-binding protein